MRASDTSKTSKHTGVNFASYLPHIAGTSLLVAVWASPGVLCWVLRGLFGQSDVSPGYWKEKEERKKKHNSNRQTVTLTGNGNTGASCQRRSSPFFLLVGAVALSAGQDSTHEWNPRPLFFPPLHCLSSPARLLLLLRAQPSCFSGSTPPREDSSLAPCRSAPLWRHDWWVAAREWSRRRAVQVVVLDGGDRTGSELLSAMHSMKSRRGISFTVFCFSLAKHLIKVVLLSPCIIHLKNIQCACMENQLNHPSAPLPKHPGSQVQVYDALM